MTLIDAVYIHESGGKSLLEFLLKELLQSNIPFTLLADERLKSDIVAEWQTGKAKFLAPTENSRRIFYKQLPKEITSIFCFANVPPPIPIKRVPVFIYFQNALLAAGLFDDNGYSIIKKLGFKAKQYYIRFLSGKRYTWIVQTEAVKVALCEEMNIQAQKITILPFFEPDFFAKPTSTTRWPNSFIYVADGVNQKNHRKLLDAWILLAEQYHLFPSLLLTIPSRFNELLQEVENLKSKGLKIINYTSCSKDQLRDLYNASECLVFPSLVESFGLPLIEALLAGCNILAANLRYMHEVIEPTAEFNPNQASNIAEVIAQYISNPIKQPPTLRVQNRVNELIQLISR